jgi:23S rRNA (uracil1939-C5)-methyltransferase
VVEHFGGAAVHYPPGAFGQNNLDIAQQIIEHVRTEIPDGARVVEFYAGVGAIGLSVLTQAGEMRMNEVSPQSLHGLELGLAELDPNDRARTSIVPGTAGAACLAAAGAQVVIADPPRKGLDPALTEYLSEQPPERFVYVSCAIESFLRDTTRLVGRGRLRLTALTAFNLLPFTEHVETIARFDRV